MSALTYTVYDGDPASSGPCAWPSHDGVEVEAGSVDALLAMVTPSVIAMAVRCGQYDAGDSLWIVVWDEDGIVLSTSRVEVQS